MLVDRHTPKDKPPSLQGWPGPFFLFSQMLAADEALVLKAGGPTLVRPGLSADIYSGKAVMMKLMGPFFARAGRGFVSSGIKCNIAMSRPT